MNNNYLLSHRKEEPENGILYIVGTPLGNLNDISQRALNILKNVSLVACEDTRQTKKIMNKFSISNKLISFNKHNSSIKIPKIVKDLKEGKSIAIVSDAGMPGICDPGEDIARRVKSEGVDIICIPGGCAAITALVSSGLPSSSFVFEGFLPKKKIDREKILFEISCNKKTTIIYESPKRLKKLLDELFNFLDIPKKYIDKFPKKNERVSKIENIAHETLNDLDRIYEKFNSELLKLDDVGSFLSNLLAILIKSLGIVPLKF